MNLLEQIEIWCSLENGGKKSPTIKKDYLKKEGKFCQFIEANLQGSSTKDNPNHQKNISWETISGTFRQEDTTDLFQESFPDFFNYMRLSTKHLKSNFDIFSKKT